MPGQGASDYERYLRTDELLALQKTPEEWIHRDELLFQTVHQSSELWLKLACAEVAEATDQVEQGELATAARLLRRAALSIAFITRQLDMLEQLSPWEYQTIRRVLGHGSGFDSPGFRADPPRLAAARGTRSSRPGSIRSRSTAAATRRRLQLAEGLVEWDEAIAVWRVKHYQTVARIIGEHVVGTQGTPGRGARAADHQADVPGALGRARPAHGPREGGGRLTLRDEVVELLQQLIRLDTVNPPGNETQAAELLRDYLAANGVESELYAKVPRPREPRRADPRERRRPAPAACSRTPTRCSRTRPSGGAIRGRASSSTARSGGAARST